MLVVEGRRPQFLFSRLFECPLGRAADSRVLEPLGSVTRQEPGDTLVSRFTFLSAQETVSATAALSFI